MVQGLRYNTHPTPYDDTVKVIGERPVSNKDVTPVNADINPWTITGEYDGDGSFGIYLSQRQSGSWRVQIVCSLTAAMTEANHLMLELVQSYFSLLGAHGIIEENGNTYVLKFYGIENAVIIRTHFISYPLFTYKLVHFMVWSQVLDLMLAGAHLTPEGLNQIIGLKAYFAEGLSPELIDSFPNLVPAECPVYAPALHLMNLFWIVGFIIADGNYYLGHIITGSVLGKVRYSITISQHSRSLVVLQAIQSFLGVGKVYDNWSRMSHDYKITSIGQINTFLTLIKDIPHYGDKELNFNSFKSGIAIINSKAHLTPAGMSEFKQIFSRMNSKRYK